MGCKKEFLDYREKKEERFSESRIRSIVRNIQKSVIKFLESTAIEVAIFGVIGLGVGVYASYQQEKDKSSKFYLSFSEIGQIFKENSEVGNINTYVPFVNDMCMKVFEAYDYGVEVKNLDRGFAMELDHHVSMKNIYPFNLTALLDSVPKVAERVKKDLIRDGYVHAKENLSIIGGDINNSWSEKHRDNYHPEIQTYSCGTTKNPQTCTRMVQVYDNTDHNFNYDTEKGKKAIGGMVALKESFPILRNSEEVVFASMTNADGEYAAEKSRDAGFEELDVDGYKKIARKWYNGSTLLNNRKDVDSLYSVLGDKMNKWSTSEIKIEPRYHYRTYSRSHSGPEEFQLAMSALGDSDMIQEDINEMIVSLDFTIENTPILGEEIKIYIDLMYLGRGKMTNRQHKKVVKNLRESIIDRTMDIYRENFKNSEDPDRFRNWIVFLFAFIGLAVGAGVGLSIDQITTNLGIYDEISLIKKKN